MLADVLLGSKRNIVFIGMPGSGKSTLGRLTAQRLGWQFFDTDPLIETRTGRKVSEIFRDDGEETFRQLETKVISELCRKRQVVISTGGGAVTRPENMAMLSMTGKLIYLDRPLELIAASNLRDRPLLAGDSRKLYRLFDERKSLYEGYANWKVANIYTPDQVVDSILAEI